MGSRGGGEQVRLLIDTLDLIERLVDAALAVCHHDGAEDEEAVKHERRLLAERFIKILTA